MQFPLVLVAQSCPTLCDPMDYNPPGSSVHEILQARVLEWVSISFSRGSSQPRDWIRVSWTAGRFFTNWAIREALFSVYIKLSVFEIFTHGPKNVFDNSKSMVNKIKQIYHIKAIKYSICSHIMLKKSCKKVNHVVTFSTPKYSHTDFLRYPHASYHITKVFIFQFKFSVSVTNNLFTIDNLSKCSKALSYF